MHLSVIRSICARLLLMASLAAPASAATLLRDPDIEHALQEIARPILRAAGLPADTTQIFIVDDRSLNAFVIDGNAIFIHSGLILKLENAGQLQSVIAHEAAHIANGHIARRMINMRNAQTAAGFGMALAVAVGATTGQGDAAAGIAAGVTGSAQRSFFAHTRAEENAADQSGLRYMLSAGVRTEHAVDVLEIFRGQEMLSVNRQDPYARTHPLTTDRLRTLRGLVAANPGQQADTADADYWFARAQGKLSAFTQNSNWTLRRVRGQDDLISTMRRAIALHRKPDRDAAIAEITALSARYPNDPYLHELRGQIFLENRQFARAVDAYRRAVELAPRNALILGGYGRALLTLNATNANARALETLSRAYDRDNRDARILRDLAVAYAKSGNPGMASLVTAERYALLGRMQDATLHASRAADQLARGTVGWQRAQDVLSAAQQAQRR